MPIRISGLVSGLDTESLVSELVSAYSVKKDNFVKAQTKLSWKQDAWKSLNKKVYSLYSGISSLRFSSAYSLKKTTVSDSTKASVTAANNAVNGTQKLVVKKLAATGYLTGGVLHRNDGGGNTEANTKLSQLTGNGFGLAEGQSGTISVNGKEISVSGDDTVNQFVNKLKDAGVNASFDATNQRIFVSSKDSGTANEFSLTASNENGAKALQSLGLMTQARAASDTQAASSEYQAYSALTSKYLDGSGNVDPSAIAEAIKNGELNVSSYDNATYQSAVRTYQYASTMLSGGDAANKLQSEYDAYAAAKSKVDSLSDTDFNKAVYDGLKKASENQLNYVFMTKDGAQVSLGDDGKIYKDGEEVGVDEEGNGYTLSEDGKSIIYTDADPEKNVTYTRSAELLSSMESALMAKYPAEDADAAYEAYTDDLKTISEYEAAHNAADRADIANVLGMDSTELTAATTYVDGDADNVLYSAAVAFGEKVATAKAAIAGTGVYAATSDAVRIDAQNSEITLNGATFTGGTNNFSINGLAIDVTGVTDDNGITITTSTDSQAIYDKVKDFLSQYNDLMNEMCSLYNAASAKGYEPLTKDEKSAMSDTEVEDWEAKVKSALLRRDTTLDSLISAMSSSMQKSYIMGKNANGNNITFTLNTDGTYAGNDGKTYTLSERSNGKYTFLGNDGSSISASGYSWSSFGVSTLGYLNSAANEYNAYHIDGDSDDDNTSGRTDKLLAAITSDPDSVIDFLKNATSSLYDSINKKMGSTSLSSAYTIYNDKEMSREYSDYNDTIKKWEDKVTDMEDSYYKKFSAMEKALATLQGQSTSLANYM